MLLQVVEALLLIGQPPDLLQYSGFSLDLLWIVWGVEFRRKVMSSSPVKNNSYL